MKAHQSFHPTRGPLQRFAGGLLLIVLTTALPLASQAESLFRASTTYSAQAPLAPRSLFTPPIANAVGDIVTIMVDDTVQTQDKAELKITRGRSMDTTGINPYNQTLSWLFGKFSMTRGLANTLSAPNISDNGSQSILNSKAENTRTVTYKENIACQVVQVLPNGDLMVQGQKTLQMNKERQDLIVTGIVKPFYLDRNNQISSKQVGNFQLIRGGRGVISRQQNDGMANKINQFFN